MEKSVRAATGALLQTAQKFGKPLNILPNSTLNQKFEVFQDLLPAGADSPITAYMAIGIGGHRSEIGTNNLTKYIAIPHRPRHTALYNHIPFLIRPPTADLTAAERVRYRLRKLIEDKDGVPYVAYYLRTLDLTTTTPRLEYRVVQDGNVTSTPWEPTLADLSPQPPAVVNNTVLTTSDDYIAATAKLPVVFTASETQEILNVVNVLYGDAGYAIISEMALCSGVDRVVTGDFHGTAAAYTEAVGVQVNDFLSTMFAAPFHSDGITINLDAGSLEPLLELV